MDLVFSATLVALHYTLVSRLVVHSFGLAELLGLRVCYVEQEASAKRRWKILGICKVGGVSWAAGEVSGGGGTPVSTPDSDND